MRVRHESGSVMPGVAFGHVGNWSKSLTATTATSPVHRNSTITFTQRIGRAAMSKQYAALIIGQSGTGKTRDRVNTPCSVNLMDSGFMPNAHFCEEKC